MPYVILGQLKGYEGRDVSDAIRCVAEGVITQDRAQELTKDDALDGFELLEHIMEEKYNPRIVRLKTISSGIKRRKGPRRPAAKS